MLIVTEGKKTEPDYFQRLVDEFDLTTAVVVRIVGGGGPAPISVFDKTKSIVDSDEDYEYIYCVFDRDQHESYGRAIENIAQLARSKKFKGKTVMASLRFLVSNFGICYTYSRQQNHMNRPRN